jgi:alkaline phosphatase
MMPFGPFLFWTTAGSLIWNLLLTASGWLLGSHWHDVLSFIKPIEGLVNKLIVLIVLAVGAWLALRIWKKRRVAP